MKRPKRYQFNLTTEDFVNLIDSITLEIKYSAACDGVYRDDLKILKQKLIRQMKKQTAKVK